MNIKKDTWHYKLYRKWLETKAKRLQGPYGTVGGVEITECPDEKLLYAIKYIKQHNLCLYIRAVLLYMPFRLIFTNVYLYIFAALSLESFILYQELAGNPIVLKLMFELGLVLFGISIIVFLVAIASYGEDKFKSIIYRRKLENEKTFYKTVIKPYMKSIKEKTCPFINFEN